MGSQTSESRAITCINVHKCTHLADHSRSTLCGGKKIGGGHCEMGCVGHREVECVVHCEVGCVVHCEVGCVVHCEVGCVVCCEVGSC